MKILVVEDNEMNMRLFSDLLKTKGYEVIKCSEGKKAIPLIIKNKPNLVLMDIQMPEISGLEITKKIRKMPSISKIKIIAVSAFTLPDEAEKMIKVGCDAYISKPISIPTFFEIIEKNLEKK